MDYETLASRGFQIGGRPLGADASYDAASTGRRLKSWQPGSPGPTRAAVSQLTTVRARSRDAVRNNGWINNGVGNWVSNEVGTGVKPRSSAPDKAFADAANKLWELCAKELDYDEQLDVYGLMAMAVRSRKEAGECFVKIHHLGLGSGNLLPIQFQIIEGEQVPHTLNETRSDREIIAGVEFQGGKRSAYWMHPRHPNDSAALINNAPIAVAARDVIHHFAPLRAGQVRGVAETVQALIKAKDFDEYDDAELTRKKTRADYTGVIKRQNFEESDWEFDPFTGDPLERDGNSAVVNMQPGTFPALLPGEEIQLFDGDQGGGYGDYMRQQLMGVAASLGIPYELLSGDMRNVNDRILRAILNEYHRRIEQSQWLYTIPQLCQGMWNAFIDAAVLVGLLKAPDYAERRREYLQCDWRPHAWAYLHPVQDIQGKLMEIGGGVNSRQAVVAARGYDVEEVDAQNAADAKRAREMGLSYTHDPVPIKDEEPESNQ